MPVVACHAGQTASAGSVVTVVLRQVDDLPLHEQNE
jgi:hypothetical protein